MANSANNESDLRWAFVAIASLYCLNDFANIFVKDWRWWLCVDYGILKLGTLLGLAFMLKHRWTTAAEIGLVRQSPAAFVLVFVSMTLIGVVMLMNLGPYLMKLFGSKAIAHMPPITDPFWYRLDTILGLILVGLTEELVFRGLLFRVLSRWTQSPVPMIYASAIVFGLIHWSSGLHAVVTTGVIGAFFMAFYVRTRSLPALVLAHFAIDYIIYGTSTVRTWFQF